jgi:predicted metal-binding protein
MTGEIAAIYLAAEAIARECGFSQWAFLEPGTMEFRAEVRAMCEADKCHAYGRSWACPPALGPLEECGARVAGYPGGILLQTTAHLEDDFDYEAMDKASKDNAERTQTFARLLREKCPDVFVFGNGACRLCKDGCTYPDAPCRFPDEMSPSLEAYGLVVSDLCKANNLSYYYGPLTLTYTSAVLFNPS